MYRPKMSQRIVFINNGTDGSNQVVIEMTPLETTPIVTTPLETKEEKTSSVTIEELPNDDVPEFPAPGHVAKEEDSAPRGPAQKPTPKPAKVAHSTATQATKANRPLMSYAREEINKVSNVGLFVLLLLFLAMVFYKFVLGPFLDARRASIGN